MSYVIVISEDDLLPKQMKLPQDKDEVVDGCPKDLLARCHEETTVVCRTQPDGSFEFAEVTVDLNATNDLDDPDDGPVYKVDWTKLPTMGD